MATPIILPRQGQSVESCIISTWNKQVGDHVSIGDVLFSYETDKAEFEEESTVEGIFLAKFFEEGDDVPCLLNVCVVGNEGEDFAQFDPNGKTEQPSEPEERSVLAKIKELIPLQNVSQTQIASSEAAFASPRAKNTASQMNIDYTKASGTGPNNRIIERDIYTLSANGASFSQNEAPSLAPIQTLQTPVAAEYNDVKLTTIRKAIAKNMLASLQNSAQLTHHVTFNATEVLALRKKLKSNAEKLNIQENITLNDIVLFAVSRALVEHKNINAHYLADQNVIREFSGVNLGVAVDTERGLMVPTIFGANKLSLCELSAQAKSVAKAAQQGTISPDLLGGATFTISNLGALDIEMFTPVLNPPQVGLLGVNTITQRPYIGDNGEIKLYSAMGLSLTYDHRAIDGAPASKFLKTLKNYLENFNLLLTK